MEGKGRTQCWAGVRAGTVGSGGRQRGACWAAGRGEGHGQWVGRPMTSLGSQLYRVPFLAAVLLLLWAKGVKPQEGSPGPDEGSFEVKTLSTGRSRRETMSGDRSPDLFGVSPRLLMGPERNLRSVQVLRERPVMVV